MSSASFNSRDTDAAADARHRPRYTSNHQVRTDQGNKIILSIDCQTVRLLDCMLVYKRFFRVVWKIMP